MTNHTLGTESPPRRAVGHIGDYSSFTSAYWTSPSTGSVVVVLTNKSSADGDASHIVAQLLMEALFDLEPKHGFVYIARRAVDAAKERGRM